MRLMMFLASGMVSGLAAIPAAAAELGPHVTLDGYVELDHMRIENFSESFLFGDLSLSLNPGVVSGLPGLGFDLDLVGAHSELPIEHQFVYGAVTYQLGDSKFSVGAPRPVWSDMINTPLPGGFGFLGVTTDVNASVTEFLMIVSDVDVPFGLRYDYHGGPLSVSASYHEFEGLPVTSTNFAARYAFRRFDVFAGYEAIGTPSADSQQYVIGVEGSFSEKLSGGLAVYEREGFDEGTESKLWASYMPNDRLTITAVGTFNSDNEDIYGISAEYALDRGAYAQIGAAKGIDASDSAVNLSLGWKF
jgi:hypothetical protein